MRSHLHSDRPISSQSDDAFNRSLFADRLYQEIMSVPDTESIVIGLLGSWGSGKTSLINLVCEKINEQRDGGSIKANDTIVVRFNPWNQIEGDKGSEEFFVRSYFDAIRNQLWADKDDWIIASSDLTNLSEVIDEYIALIHPGFIKATASVATKLFGKRCIKQRNTIEGAKSQIRKALGGFGVKILVVIDDIDRLSKDRICLIFQLITTIADFESVNYLIAYDENVVERAVSDIQGISGREYLEKVIQVPIHVPWPSAVSLHAAIDRCFGYIPNEYYSSGQDVEDAASRFSTLLPLLQKDICTVRQMNRLENALRFKLPIMCEHLDAIDLLAMEYLRIVFPETMQWVIERSSSLCTQDRPSAPIEPLSQMQLNNMLDDLRGVLANGPQGPGSRSTTSIEIVRFLFAHPRHLYHQRKARTYALRVHKRIVDSKLFELYLTSDVTTVDSVHEIIAAFAASSGTPDLSGFIKTAAGNDKYLEAIEACSALSDKLNARECAVVITALAENIQHAERTRTAFSENTRTVDIIDSLLQRMDEEGRDAFVLELFRSLDSLSVIFMAEFIIRQERAYERNRFKGGSYQAMITEDSLEALEQFFIMAMLTVGRLTDLPDIFPQLTLCRNIDDEAFRALLSPVSKDCSCLTLFAFAFVSPWYSMDSSGIASFTVDAGIFDYSTEDSLRLAGRELVSSDSFWGLPSSTRQRTAALIIALDLGSLGGSVGEEIEVNEVDRWLEMHRGERVCETI